jgi:hypothetical protein
MQLGDRHRIIFKKDYILEKRDLISTITRGNNFADDLISFVGLDTMNLHKSKGALPYLEVSAFP